MEVSIRPNSAIIIPRVKVWGSKASREIDMILDSGAMYTSISWDIAKDIGYDPARIFRRASIVTANGVIEVPLFEIDHITIFDLKATKVRVICHDIPEVVEVEGLLGLSFLQHFRTTIDFKSRKVKIESF